MEDRQDVYMFAKNWNFTAHDARLISKLPKGKGKTTLARRLLLEPLDEEINLRECCLLDYYYDTLQFASNRGFPWHEVAGSISFAYYLISRAIHGNITNAVRVLHDVATQHVKQNRIGIKNAKLLIKYFSSNFLTSFKLFKHVFSFPQEDQTQHKVIPVQTTPSPLPLDEADTSEIWKFNQRLESISKDEVTRTNALEKLRNNINERLQLTANEIDDVIADEKQEIMPLKVAEELLSSVAEKELKVLQEDVFTNIQELQDVSEIAILKKSIPIPVGLNSSATTVKVNKENQKKK